MQDRRRYSILSLLQAILGSVITLATVLSYQLAPAASLPRSSLTISIAGLGAAAALYYLSIHQLLKKRHLQASSMMLNLITTATILLVILATGGLDSPYYALWLLGIVIAGLFGTFATSSAVVITLGFYGYEFYLRQQQSGYILAHVGQLVITIATALVAEWLHTALGRTLVQNQQVSQLSGQLTQEELKSNVLMHSMADGVLVVNAQRQIQLFNPAATRLTGWDEGSARNIDYRLVLNLRDAKGNQLDDAADPLSQMAQQQKSLARADLSMLTKAGRKTAISLSLSPIFGPNHTVAGGIVLFRDISAEKEVERQRSEFISTASHEMRTPVAAIEGYLSLAMNPNVATIDARAKSYLEKAHGSTQHLGALFQDLLTITKLEDGKVDTEEVFDLTKLVEGAVEDMRFSADKKGLGLQFAIAGETVRSQHSVKPVYAVKGNPQRLCEVVMNFIENAIKFTAQGEVQVSVGGTNDTVTVSVTDSGMGIAAEDVPHLFQKFYRIDNGATRTIGGTGLGLYLCRTIIELIGGHIWVESKLGKGSSFRFSVPRQSSEKVQSADAAASAATTPAATAITTPTVLTAVTAAHPATTPPPVAKAATGNKKLAAAK